MRITACMSLALVAAFSQAGVVRRVFTPAPSPDGKQLLFCWQGDIWKSGIAGENPVRLTIHPAQESNPRWSVDGKNIVFMSNRAGSDDLYTMDADGQGLKRLTFDSAPERLYAVDGEFAYGYGSLLGRSNLFKVSLKGGEMLWMTKHPLETSYHVTPAGNGKVIYVGGGSSGNWNQPAYKGAGSGELWMADNTVPAKNFVRLTTNEANDMFPMVSGGKVYFVSNRSGHPNLWTMDISGKGAKQLTKHEIGTMRWPSLGGGKIAYEQDSDVWIFDVASGKTEKLVLNLPEDTTNADAREITVSSGMQGMSVSPDTKRIALIIRGDVFVMAEKGGLMRRVSKPLSRVSTLTWLDAKTVLYTSRRNGKSELYKADLQGKETLVLSDEKDIYGPEVSADGKWISFARGFNQLCVMPAAGGAVKVVSDSPTQDSFDGTVLGHFSPDGKWIVYLKELPRCSAVQVYNIESGATSMIGTVARANSTPQFTATGKAVYLIGVESDQTNLYQIDLAPSEVTFSEDDIDSDGAPKRPEPGTKIEMNGILDRMRVVASDISGAWAGPDGRTYYANVNGQLSTVGMGAVNPVPGVKGPGALTFAGGKAYLLQAAGSLARLTEAGPAPISYSATFNVDNRAEESALFDDICWALSRAYYRADLNGHDLNAMRKRYQGILPYTNSRADFYSLMGEFVEEFDSSHMGATGPSDGLTAGAGEQTGWLSIDFDYSKVANGHYVVSKVTVDGAGSKAGLQVGDEIVSVNGTALGSMPWAAHLKNSVGRKVALGVKRGGKDLTLNARPSSSLVKTNEFYEEYVAWTRAEVEKQSGGKLTYMHIKGMDEPSYQRFLREIRTLTNDKKGVIIDVRFNGGGSTSHKLLGILVKQTWLLRDTRSTKPISENIYRGDALELPTALMTNQYSFSNAEIMSEGFRYLKRGPIIGERTAGGVIGTGAFGLFDGGMIRMPMIGCYTVNGENLERDGRMPDVNVSYDPNAWHSGRDPQTEAAVKELLKKLK